MTDQPTALAAVIRALPYNVMDDYDEVRRDEREKIIAALAVAHGEAEQMKRSVAEVMQEDGGCWSACSGCQESVDGCVSSRDYPYSPIFKCQPGGGCGECGGIGVIWEDGAFLASYGDALSNEPDQWMLAHDVEGLGRAVEMAGGEALREKVARIIATGVFGDPWWWKEAFDDGSDEIAVRNRADDVSVADDILAALATPASDAAASDVGPVARYSHEAAFRRLGADANALFRERLGSRKRPTWWAVNALQAAVDFCELYRAHPAPVDPVAGGQALREDQVEVAAMAFAKAFYGPGFDPFTNPEAYAMAEEATRSAIATLPGIAERIQRGIRLEVDDEAAE